jgi:hypothetical protein
LRKTQGRTIEGLGHEPRAVVALDGLARRKGGYRRTMPPRGVEDRRNQRGIDEGAGAIVDEDDVRIGGRLDARQGRRRPCVTPRDDGQHAVDATELGIARAADLLASEDDDGTVDFGARRHRANGARGNGLPSKLEELLGDGSAEA